MTAIAAEIEVAGRDTEVRLVAVRGAGGHFSAGDDLQAAIEADTVAWAETIEAFQRMTRVVLAAPVPVVAVVDGVCVGGALEFAASCDLRLCSNRVRLLTPEVGIGLVASNAGTLLLPELLARRPRVSSSHGEPRDAEGRSSMVRHRMVAPGRLDARIEHWTATFSERHEMRGSHEAMLNERFGQLLPAAMERETHHCVRLFDEPDARAALSAFAER